MTSRSQHYVIWCFILQLSTHFYWSHVENLSASYLSVAMDSCRYHATCSVTNYVPQCGCDPGYTGDAFIACQRLTTPSAPTEVIDPCNPSPCGINTECRERQGAASCTCLPGLQGNPCIECKPECSINPDCPINLACIRNKCKCIVSVS